MTAQNAMQAFLIVEGGSLKGRRIPLPAAGTVHLGRETDCDVRFDPQQERMVGRHHARIEVRPDGTFLIDSSSANKTWWSDETALVPESPRRLKDGDRFLLGGEGGPWLRVEIPYLSPPTILQDAPRPRGPVMPVDPMATVVIPPKDTRVFPMPVLPPAPGAADRGIGNAGHAGPGGPFAQAPPPRPAPPSQEEVTRPPGALRVEPIREPRPSIADESSLRSGSHQRDEARAEAHAEAHDRSVLVRQVMFIVVVLVLSGAAGVTLGLNWPPPADHSADSAQ